MIKNATHYLRHLRVKTQDDLLAYVAQNIVKLQALGKDIRVREDAAPLNAQVNRGRWIIKCQCGAGNAAHPDWARSACSSCGRIHTSIVFPNYATRLRIEHALNKRSRDNVRFWDVSVDVDRLAAEIPDAVVIPDRTRP